MSENAGKGKWLSAEEALAAGLIDQIINATAINNKFNPEAQGLPALPQNHIEMEDKKVTVLDRLLGFFEKAESDSIKNQLDALQEVVDKITAERDEAVANIATIEAERETLNATIAERDAEILNLQAQLAEAKAMAVQPTNPTQNVDDPDPQAKGATKTANQQAYEAELAAFRK